MRRSIETLHVPLDFHQDTRLAREIRAHRVAMNVRSLLTLAAAVIAAIAIAENSQTVEDLRDDVDSLVYPQVQVDVTNPVNLDSFTEPQRKSLVL